MFSIDFDLGDLEKDCNRAEAEFVTTAQHAPLVAAQAGVSAAVARKDYRDRTGKLSGTARGQLLAQRTTGSTAVMKWPRPYASFVDQGTIAHPIVARRAMLLVFFWERMGTMFYGKRVNHPGTRARKFTDVAVEVAERVLGDAVERSVERVRRILG